MAFELGNVSLRKVSEGWEFSSELALEDFIWEHLETLLQLKPFQLSRVSFFTSNEAFHTGS